MRLDYTVRPGQVYVVDAFVSDAEVKRYRMRQNFVILVRGQGFDDFLAV